MYTRIVRVFGILMMAMMFASMFTDPGQAQSDYRIRPGDTLRIEVLEDSALNRNVLVLPDGSISFPLVGTVRASGGTVGQLQQALAGGLASNFAATPNVFVSVDALAERKPATRSAPASPPTIDVYTVGEIAKPGILEVSPGTTILQLIAQAGGPTKFAAHRRIELRRTDPATGATAIYLFSYTGHAKGQRISGSTTLIEGDVIVVPERRLFE